jgi:flavin-binding protein dodecin
VRFSSCGRAACGTLGAEREQRASVRGGDGDRCCAALEGLRGVDHATRNAITRASRTLRNLDWFEVVEVRGYLSEGGIDHFQVRLKVGFRLEEQGTT